MCVEDYYKVPKKETKRAVENLYDVRQKVENFVQYNLMESVVKLGM